MLPMRFFRKPGVRARERLVAVHVLRDVRLDLPALAVLPDRAGLLAARAPGCGSCRGRSRRCSSPRSPARCRTGSRGKAARRRSGSRCRRSALAWIAARLHADVAYSELDRARSSSPGSGWRSSSPRWRTSSSRPSGRRRRARRRAPTTRSASSAASSASPCSPRCSRRTAATRAAQAFSDGMNSALNSSARSSSGSERCRASRSPAAPRRTEAPSARRSLEAAA